MRSVWNDRAPQLPSDPLPTHRVDDVVVGAGLSGLTTAVLLARSGRDVAVLEAREVGAGTTGGSTAKVSLLQGTRLSRLLAARPEHEVVEYVAANRGGQHWLERFCSEHQVPTLRRDAVTYAADATEVASVQREHRAAHRLGLEVTWRDRLDVPFPLHGATVLAEQLEVDPVRLLTALVEELRHLGGCLVQQSRVTHVPPGGRGPVGLADGSQVETSSVVLATGAPIVDRGLHFARLEPQRSYALAWRHDAPPAGMFLSAGSSNARSVRDAVGADGSPLLLVGGQGHVVGRTDSERTHLDTLRQWTRRHFPGAVETHAWSAQDYRSLDGLPHVGTFRGGGPHLRVATGYDKWGMAAAVAAAHVIAAQVRGDEPPWARSWQGRRPGPRALREGARVNAGVVVAGARGAAAALVRRAPTEATDESPCRVRTMCTHLGGALRWNDAEQSWDCPLHGSRFASDGTVLEGPATRPLRPREP